MRSRSILVVEDEPTIASSIAARLRQEGFNVEVADDGPGGVEAYERLRPDLVVLDLMLPGFDGLEVCRRIQTDRPVPVLMLTARDSETDMLLGLGMGADDYMTKPFSPRELVARVHAILRRAQRVAPSDTKLFLGNVEIDPVRRRVVREGSLVHLTPTEFDLLYRLAAKPGAVFTREQLMEDIWGYQTPVGTRTVDSHVRSLRQKLAPDLIRTVHGVGYAVEEQ